MTERWPFAFDPDDILVENIESRHGTNIGVLITHPASGAEISMSAMPTREENIQAGMRRLDREVRRRNAPRE
jgi:alcohol dehydrogenase YqhD (iron-dependent ADH family)